MTERSWGKAHTATRVPPVHLTIPGACGAGLCDLEETLAGPCAKTSRRQRGPICPCLSPDAVQAIERMWFAQADGGPTHFEKSPARRASACHLDDSLTRTKVFR